jgi:hypothetical protein
LRRFLRKHREFAASAFPKEDCGMAIQDGSAAKAEIK